MCNMNSRDGRKWRDFLKEKNGGYCQWCKVSDKDKQLVIDHKDNHNNNNHPDNLQLLCRSCNYKKNPRLSEREPLDKCVSVGNKQNNNQNTTQDSNIYKYYSTINTPSEIEINRAKEPRFIIYIEKTIDEHGEWEEIDLKNSGAQAIGISTTTAKRYLDKMCSRLEGNYIKFKIDTETFIKKKTN